MYIALQSPDLTEVQPQPTGADGHPLRFIGACKLDILLGGNVFPYRVWVIDRLSAEMLIGLEFMKQYRTLWSISEKTATIEGISFPIQSISWHTLQKPKRTEANDSQYLQLTQFLWLRNVEEGSACNA